MLSKSLLVVVCSFVAVPFGLCGAEPKQTLEQDAARLTTARKTVFRSTEVELQFDDGSRSRQILVMEFSPFQGAREPAPQASVKLSMVSPTVGIKGLAEVNTSVGQAAPSDVRLQDMGSVRTITIVRAIETIEKPTAKTPRILEQSFSSRFNYELTGDTLILKGLSKTEPTKWGIFQFAVPKESIVFTAVK